MNALNHNEVLFKCALLSVIFAFCFKLASFPCYF
jgi:hypothetical protein